MKSGKFSKLEDEFILENYLTMTVKDMAFNLDRKLVSVQDRMRKLNLIKIKKEVWSDEEIELLKEKYNKTIDIFDMFPGRTRQSIAYKAHDLGLKKYNRGNFSVDYSFFKTWSEEMAYILGLICADGNICSDEVKRLTITLHNNDLYMLEKISNIMKNKRPIFKRKTGCNDLVITCGEIYDDLISLGVVPKKSLTLKWIENIPKDYLKHFVRGYFDGDGCVSVYTRTRKTYIEDVLEVAMLGTPEFLNGMSTEVHNSIGIHKVKAINCSTVNFKSNAYRIRWTYSNAEKFLKWIYKDANIYLIRKREKFENYLKKQDTSSNT